LDPALPHHAPVLELLKRKKVRQSAVTFIFIFENVCAEHTEFNAECVEDLEHWTDLLDHQVFYSFTHAMLVTTMLTVYLAATFNPIHSSWWWPCQLPTAYCTHFS
jgi:hypothetical protein